MTPFPPSLRASAFVVGLLAAICTVQADVLLDTTFADNSQSPPETVRWMVSGGALAVDACLTQTPNNNQREAVAYFNPVSVPEGKTLTLEFVFSVKDPKNAGSGFRIGLFDSEGGPKVNRGNFEPIFEGYTGYALGTNLRSNSPDATQLQARDPALGVVNLIQNIQAFAPDLTNGIGADISGSNVEHTGNLSVTNKGDEGVKIVCQIGNSEPVSVMDKQWKNNTFDTIAFSFRQSAGTSISFHSMKLAVD